MKSRLAAFVITAALATAACTKSKPTEVPAQPPAVPSTEQSKVDPKAQANGFLSRGDYEKAIAAWKAIVEKEPTADNYNELSYVYLMAKRWQEALAAGQAALKIEPNHKYATFNTGVAALESGDLCRANQRLTSSVWQQPDRYEPHMELARVHERLGDYPKAREEAQKAVELSKKAPDAEAVLASVEAMRTAPAPADVTSVGTIKYQDSSVTVYLYPEQPLEFCGQPTTPYTLYSVHKQGKTLRLPLGPIAKDVRFGRVPLPGGANGFFLRVGEIGAYVAHSSAYSFFVDNGQELFQVVFHAGDKGRGYSLSAVGSVMRSGGEPDIEGGLIKAHHMNDASGYYDVYATWQLSPGLQTATLLEVKTVDPLEPFEPKDGTAVSIDEEKLVIKIDGKDVEFPTVGYEVQVSGGIASLRELKPGAKVRLAFRNGKLLRVQFSR